MIALIIIFVAIFFFVICLRSAANDYSHLIKGDVYINLPSLKNQNPFDIKTISCEDVVKIKEIKGGFCLYVFIHDNGDLCERSVEIKKFDKMYKTRYDESLHGGVDLRNRKTSYCDAFLAILKARIDILRRYS